MKVLVLNQHYWPEVAATAQILSDLCEDLVDAGHEVVVVCGQPSYRETCSAPRARAEIHAGVQIRRVWCHVPRTRGIAQRIASYASYFTASLVDALRGPRPDVCLVLSTPPLLLGVSGALMRTLRSVPFVYSVQDLYPDVAIHLGVLRASSAITRIANLASNTCYRSAAANVTLSSSMARKLVSRGVDPRRVHVIPNWADTIAIAPQAGANSFAQEHGLSGFIVQYSGNLGLSQGLDAVIGAAALLRDLPITFALIGDGNARARLQQDVLERGLQNVRILSPQPRERLPELLAACDVGLVTMKYGVSDDLVPSKFYGIMAAARPVVAAVEAHSEIARVVQDANVGWIVRPEDPAALAEGIREAYLASPDERGLRGRNGRALCVAEYSRRSATRRYIEVLESVTTPRAARSAARQVHAERRVSPATDGSQSTVQVDGAAD